MFDTSAEDNRNVNEKESDEDRNSNTFGQHF